jgi:hypothetical protein
MSRSVPPVQFDREKFKETVLYIITHCDADHLGAVKLHKCLYFSDMLHFAFYGAPITGSQYRKRPFGPTSDDLLPALNDLSRAGAIDVQDVNYFGYRKKEYVGLRDPDSSRFNEHEQGLLNDVIEFVCRGNTAKTISEFSHNRAWEKAEYGAELPYHTAFYLLPMQVSEEAKEWASKEVECLEAERSEGKTLGRRSFGAFRSRLLQARGGAS